MTEKRRLVREPGTARPRAGRLERAEGARDESTEGDPEHAERRRRRGGARSVVLEDASDLNRGMMMVSVESAAIAMDIVSRVLRGAVDRAFDEDYDNPGDIVRGITGEADLAVHDLLGELRNVPRRLTHRFDEATASPNTEQGERKRRADGAASNQSETPSSGK